MTTSEFTVDAFCKGCHPSEEKRQRRPTTREPDERLIQVRWAGRLYRYEQVECKERRRNIPVRMPRLLSMTRSLGTKRMVVVEREKTHNIPLGDLRYRNSHLKLFAGSELADIPWQTVGVPSPIC